MWRNGAISGILTCMKILRRNRSGFTVVELTVAIAIVGILTAIGVTSYRTYAQDSRVATMKRDMQEMKLAIEKYYAKHGSYPLSNQGNNVWGRRAAHGEHFITQIVPEHMATTKDVTFGDKSDTWANTYLYRSTGREYKLIRLAEANKSLPDYEIAQIETALQDPIRWSSSSPQYRAWGYWSPGGESSL